LDVIRWGKQHGRQMAIATKELLQVEQMDVLADKGYHTGGELMECEYARSIERNNARVMANPNYYRQRQQLAEHPFGTLKRQRGFIFTLMKGKEKVLGEVGLEFIGYNLTRCVSILGFIELCKALKKCAFIVLNLFERSFLSLFKQLTFKADKMQIDQDKEIIPSYSLENDFVKLYLSVQF